MKTNSLLLAAVVLLFFSSQLFSVVDSSTMNNKIMMGYQGWFTAAGDGNTLQNGDWYHWGRSNQVPNGTNLHFDMYPDMREFDADELYDTTMTLNGSPAPVFSSRHPKTINRHFKWMREYGVDGVFLQRFTAVIQGNPTYANHLNTVLTTSVSAAETEGRVFAVMYDISGSDPSRIIEAIQNDWVDLMDNMGVASSDRYLKHMGKPVVGIWGFGFNDRNVSVADAQTIIDWFKTDAPPQYQATLVGGVPTYWREQDGFDVQTDPGWAAVFRSFDVISPWAVGRYKNYTDLEANRMLVLEPDIAETNSLNLEYMPVVFPGFSWTNLHGGPLNEIPRDGGRFYWRQIHNAVNAGCNMIYVAMFDEVDEATAMFKTAETQADCPDQGTYLTLDADGFNIPSDWYLQLANETGKVLRGEQPLAYEMPIGNLPALGPPPVPRIIDVEFDSQSVPQTMVRGGTYSVTVNMLNSGNTAWDAGGPIRLGSQNPQDNTNWGMNRVLVSTEAAAGAVYSFTFNVTAPLTIGDYNFQWKMVEEGVAWFGPLTDNVVISVIDGVLPNQPPSWSSNPVIKSNAVVDVAYSGSIGSDASDPDGDTLSFAKTGGAAWLNVTTEGTLSGTPGARDLGPNSITITVEDGNHSAVSAVLNVYVDSAPPPPPPPGLVDRTNEAGGIVSSQYSDSPAGEDDVKAFDNTTATKYLTFNNASWIQYQFANGNQYTIVRYSISSANDAPERDPQSWTLAGSNNGIDWTTIDSRSFVDFAERFQKNEFVANNSTAYNYYRFTMSNNSGSILQFSEIELFGDENEVSDQYSAWKSTHGITDDAADADNDGLQNLLEYALGGDPNIKDDSLMPTAVENGSNIDFSFQRDAGDISYTVESSTDLINWTTEESNPGNVDATVIVSVPNSGKLFLRLRVDN